MRTLKRFYIFGTLFMLIGMSSPAHALYSPTLSIEVNRIQNHIREAQGHNGVGSLMEISQTIISQEKAMSESNLPTGMPGLAQEARKKVARTATLQSVRAPLDGLMMVFNVIPSQGGGVISNCLRNDIWTLESLRDIVGQEMIKAYMLGASFHGNRLSKDYDYLIYQIELLKRQGNNPDALVNTMIETDGEASFGSLTMKEYLFGKSAEVYYYSLSFPSDLGCPEGDFEKAFVRVANSAKTLATLSSGKGADWGSIWEMAEVRAKQRAAQWFAANQIAFTLGGGQGGRQQSLVKNNGWDQRMAEIQTQLRMLKNLAGPITAPFSLDIYQHIDGVSNVGGDAACVFFQPAEGKYYPCNPEQVEVFQTCQLTVASAKEKGLIDKSKNRAQAKTSLEELKAGYSCRRFKSTRFVGNLSEHLEQAKEEEQQAKLEWENELLAFHYQVQFNDVGEESLEILAKSLVGLENEIKRGIEASGNPENDPGLPSFSGSMSTMANRHCANITY